MGTAHLCYTGEVLETRSSLLRRLKDSCDERSWGEFVALYEPLLLSYVRRRGLGEDDARDVVQDILASLFRSLPSFDFQRTRGRFRTWLWRVAQNAIADWARRQARQRKAEKGWRERLVALREGLATEPEAEWETAHQRRVLEFSLERVRQDTPHEKWACFERHVVAGRPGAEVARDLGISVNLVYVNASRVLARVREVCTEYMDEPWDESAG
ncbi:MAG: sigma-70 family RNA polymerase sigma factor [Planctomycetes bacterium]|nr:sigma-70 family RNA polymerase sigma factor [Planctomycetota bacterium]